MPATTTSRVRELSRGGGRKNDQIDAAAAATVAHLHGDRREVRAEDHSTALAPLDERRVNLAQARVRAVNPLHALLRDLLPGGAPDQMSADQAAALLHTVRPLGAVEKVRKGLARDLVVEVRALDKQLAANAAHLTDLVAAADSTLTRTRHRSGARRTADRPSRTGQPLPHQCGIRELHRHCPSGDCQR
ncbi:transposase [Streptomyces sp. NPDC058293]|uniref:IS110 family transposase n=1 Tax=Streptomyces sp. NPDC058293 TaxID=3346429 RepID=UPI0036DFEEAF